MTIKKTGGTWNAKHWPMYFIAADLNTLEMASAYADDLLIAVNIVTSTEAQSKVVRFLDRDKKVLIDSGVYDLTAKHALKHKVPINVALGLAPSEVDGFDDLFASYVALVSQIGERSWGYVEIDLGGRENKIKTRAKLEAAGLVPIPVYHPINDGWDYFDYLAERYDRICLGNVAMAENEERMRIVATAWERRRKYPHLWIHCLGVTPSDLITAYPLSSCDSSSWISPIKWGSHKTTVANVSMGDLGIEFLYDRSMEPEHPRGHRRAREMCGYDAAIVGLTMRNIRSDQETELGCDLGLFGKRQKP